MLLDVTAVEVRPDFLLRLDFENGERRSFDMRPLLERRPFDRLKNAVVFRLARVEGGTVVCPATSISRQRLYATDRRRSLIPSSP
ncbi:MAG: DUF2442 domain-containing protein [Chromatiales bacterium]|nr:DUF2442 domain-containing protein [Chromatiales bacterium]